MILDFRARQYPQSIEGHEEYVKEFCVTTQLEDELQDWFSRHHVTVEQNFRRGGFVNAVVNCEEPLDLETFLNHVERRPIPELAEYLLEGIATRIPFLRGYARHRDEGIEELARMNVEKHLLTLGLEAMRGDKESLAEFVESYELLASSTRNEHFIYAFAWAVRAHEIEEEKKKKAAGEPER